MRHLSIEDAKEIMRASVWPGLPGYTIRGEPADKPDTTGEHPAYFRYELEFEKPLTTIQEALLDRRIGEARCLFGYMPAAITLTRDK